MYPRFEDDIRKMNETYELAEVPTQDWSAVTKRLAQFKEILDKEFVELDDIVGMADNATDDNWPTGELPLQIQVAMADLLGDIIVYCTSEARRWNIPLAQVLMIIMASNNSKLGADGKPIKNPVTDKFEKGPYYWKPEPLIKMLLEKKNVQIDFDEHGSIHITEIVPDAMAVMKLDMDKVVAAAIPHQPV